jgi:hypothetical protein
MNTPVPPPNKEKPSIKSALIGLTAISFGSLALIPCLLGLFIVGAVAWYGIRFLWQLFQLLAT